ncbi:acyl-CoA thioesterase [Streptomyces sp. BE230]|uniref:acyl-CoA thioesterase n=1 Tax=Streptomyces sp. BE230 TaxID=3002526 RepID=UPI002ED4B355|nr:acyl-CoA thioesterase domain-containing protein [Streptomyces sp. BE230]
MGARLSSGVARCARLGPRRSPAAAGPRPGPAAGEGNTLIAEDIQVAQGAAFLDFADVLHLEPCEGEVSAGWPHAGRPPRAFGGVTLAQALLAATRTVDPGRRVHSVHGHFLRSVDTTAPVRYACGHRRDGISYAARSVEAQQHGRTVLDLTVSFKLPEKGLDLRPDAPSAPDPDDCPAPYRDLARDEPDRYADRTIPRVMDLRIVEQDATELAAREQGLSRQRVWVRSNRPMPDDPALHTAALAYFSDLTLSPTATLPWEPRIGEGPRGRALMLASLDHALWIHRDFRADAWLLYTQRTLTVSDGRALSQGEMWTPEGELVATVAQESVLRHRPAGA